MRTSILSVIKGYVRTANTWFLRTPERALNEAYEAAQAIRAIEEAHFAGGRISRDFGNYGESAQAYFQGELRKYLGIIRVRLAEFNLSRPILRISSQPITEIQMEDDSRDQYTISVIDKPSLTLKKLRYIDEVLARYSAANVPPSSVILVPQTNELSTTNPSINRNRNRRNPTEPTGDTPDANARPDDIESIVDKTGVLPRSILKTVDRIKRELDPKAEEEVIESFRSSKARTIISLRLVLLLIIVPLLTQQLTKIAIVGPLVDQFRSPEVAEVVFLNAEMEEEAMEELRRFEEHLKFQALLGRPTALTQEEIEVQLKEKVEEIELEYREESSNAIKNVFADLFSVGAFALLILTSKREIAVLKSFIDELVYGLSDSAKAFIIILLTDMFVGFHSPHGWEVLLESVARHLGLPANRDFIFLFIATFPVILDTIFKYWIFRYLNRISPSAVATYRNMNE